jgi:mannosyltransferase
VNKVIVRFRNWIFRQRTNASASELPFTFRNVSRSLWILSGITILAGFLRLLYLGRESLWWDESLSVAVAHLDWKSLWNLLSRFEGNMALYYGLLHLWINFGESEHVVRSLSTLAGLMAVPSIYALGRRLFGTKVGLIGAMLLATNTFHIKYSQEARGYALLVLLVILSSLFLLRAIEDHSVGNWAGYVLTSVCAVYSHFFGVLVIGAQLISLAVFLPRNVPWKRLLVSLSLIAFLLLPAALFVIGNGSTSRLGWIPRPTVYSVFSLYFYSFAGGGRLLFLAYSVLCSIACVFAVRAWLHRKASFDSWHYALLLSWSVFPVVALLVISLRSPVFLDKYLIICLPPLVLLASVGLSQIRHRGLLAGCLLVLLIMSGRRVFFSQRSLEKEDWRGATSYVVSHGSPQDGVLFYLYGGRFSFDYYVRRLLPASQGWKVAYPEPWDWENGWTQAELDNSLIGLLPERHEQVWLFLSHNAVSQPRRERTRSIQRSLANQYPNVEETDFNGVRVFRYSRGEPAETP